MDPSFVEEMIQLMQGPSCIPGVSMRDVFAVSTKLAMDKTNTELKDPALQARVAHWKTASAAALKGACGNAGCQISGNKSVLALRLALKGLPENVPAASPTPATKAAGKRKAWRCIQHND